MFKRKEELYTINWDRPVTVKIGEWIPKDEQPKKLRTVRLPTMPPEEEMVNYGLPVKEQKFVRRPVPQDIRFWDQKIIDEYVEAEWHRRRNGYWILIKGHPYYITGSSDIFFNFWTAEFGGVPKFKFGQLEWWWEWFDIENDKDCFGEIDIKCRRLGDTEVALCAVWERSTRYKNFNGGIIHLDEDGALKNHARLVNGNKSMPFFYKPINTGTTQSKGGVLEFDIPAETITRKRLKEGYFNEEVEVGLGSTIYVEAAKTGAFDGVRLGTYYSDETFKAMSHKFDSKKQWKNIKRVTSLNNEKNIVGKSIMTSTIEEIDDGRALQIAQEFVDDSAKIMPSGRSVTGLRIVFRGYQYGTETDEWGFHIVGPAKKERDDKIDFYRHNKMYEELTDLYRKEPATLEEALSAIAGDCILYPQMCEERLKQLERGVDRNGKQQRPRGQYGDLIWTNGFGSTVKWVPRDGGKWFISQHPDVPNNAIRRSGKAYPGNMHKFRMGSDPFDSDETNEKGSDGAFTVKRLMNLFEEPNELLIDDNGEVLNVEDMMTNQYVCDYTDRPESPYDFYEDVYKTCVYYGVGVFPETDKPGLRTWMKAKGLKNYLQVPPEELVAASSRKKDARGATSTPGNISQYIDFLKMHIHKYVWCEYHPRLLNNWKRFTKKDRTKFDLSVASGFTELAIMDTRYVEKKEESQKDRWETLYEPQYQN